MKTITFFDINPQIEKVLLLLKNRPDYFWMFQDLIDSGSDEDDKTLFEIKTDDEYLEMMK